MTVTVSDNGSPTNTISRSFTVFVRATANANPTIQRITDQSTSEDTPITIPITVNDDAAVTNLVLGAISSDPDLFPTNTMVFSGTTSNRNLTFTPPPNRTGSATITVWVTDAAFGYASTNFVLTVNAQNDLPTISGIGPQTINENTTLGPLAFTVSDVETPTSSLTINPSSSNQALVPNANIAIGGYGTNRAVMLNPLPEQSGTATITLTVTDGNGGSTNTTFTVTVNSQNSPPTISDIPNQTINEDAATAAIPFTIGDAETPTASLTPSATSSNPALIPNANVVFGGSGANRTVTVTPLPDQFGVATITVTITDGGGSSTTDTFTVTINPVNDLPTLDPIGNINLNQGAGAQTVNLTGIAFGPTNEAQTLAISAESSNPTLIPSPTVNYTSPASSGVLTFAPVAETNGTATITVTVNDGQSQNGTITRTFTVTVNGTPTISQIADQTINEDSSTGPIAFVISDESDVNSLVLTASSSNTNVVPASGIALGGSGSNRTITITPPANQFGFSLITLSLSDPQGNVSSNSFGVVVNSVNDVPTLDPIGNITTNKNPGPISIPLTGIGFGPTNEMQTLTLTAVSSNVALVPNPSIAYTSPNPTATLSFTPVSNAVGTVTIAVKAQDNGGIQFGGQNSVTRTFTVTLRDIPPPPLAIRKSGANVLLSWPATGTFIVQSKDNIVPAGSWVDVSGTPTLVGTNYSLSQPATAARKFYRLRN